MLKNKSILTLLAVLLICNTTSPQFGRGKAKAGASGLAALLAATSVIANAVAPNDPAAKKVADVTGNLAGTVGGIADSL